MVDYRSRGVDPELIRQSVLAGRDRTAENIQGAISGATSGLESVLKISQAIGDIKDRRRKVREIAEIAQAEDTPAKAAELGLEPAAYAEAAVREPVKLAQLKATINKNTMSGQSQSQFNLVRSELLKEYKTDPAGFKKRYGDEGLTIIGGKQVPWFDMLMKNMSGGGAAGVSTELEEK